MKTITYLILATTVFIYVNLLIMRENPCTAFSEHPERCSSDSMAG